MYAVFGKASETFSIQTENINRRKDHFDLYLEYEELKKDDFASYVYHFDENEICEEEFEDNYVPSETAIRLKRIKRLERIKIRRQYIIRRKILVISYLLQLLLHAVILSVSMYFLKMIKNTFPSSLLSKTDIFYVSLDESLFECNAFTLAQLTEERNVFIINSLNFTKNLTDQVTGMLTTSLNTASDNSNEWSLANSVNLAINILEPINVVFDAVLIIMGKFIYSEAI